MEKIYFVCLFSIIVSNTIKAQEVSIIYQNRIDTLDRNIYKYFYDSVNSLYYETEIKQSGKNLHSYLWPLCALIQAANEAELLQPKRDYMTPVLKAINQYYSTIPPKPAYQAFVTKEKKDDRYFDDNQWIAIACIDAFNRTNNHQYLEIAKNIYHFMMTGYDNNAGGGLYWKEGDKRTKNTCSNGPGILIALQLYKITNNKSYLDTALILYDWTNKHLQTREGIYYDAIKIPSLKIDSSCYTYNSGTMLQSNVLLYNLTKNKKYLLEAQRISKAVKVYFYKNGTLKGNYWFNAVLLRGVVELFKVDKNSEFVQIFMEYANKVWEYEKNLKGMIGKSGIIPRLIDQCAMMEIFARLAQLNYK